MKESKGRNAPVVLDDTSHGGLVPVAGGKATGVGLTVAGGFGETHVWAAFFKDPPIDPGTPMGTLSGEPWR